MQASYDKHSTQPQIVEHHVRGEGVTSSVSQLLGPGATLTRTGAGAYRITWGENPGTYKGASYGLAAATPANLAGHSVIFDEYDATNLRLDFVVYNDTPAAHDLAADEYIDVFARFATTSVGAA